MFLTIKNRRIFYDLLGMESSAPIVCMTHSLTADGGMWAEQVPALLQSGYRVLRLDMRGHGASDSVPGDYTMDDLADDVVHVLDGLGCQDVHYVGLSIGGMLGQSLGLRYPDRVRSLMLCDTLPASIPTADSVWVERKRIVSDAQSLKPVAESTMARWFTPTFRDHRTRRWSEIYNSIIATRVDGFLGCAAAVQSFDFTKQLPTLRKPVLVVCGDNDSGTPPSENQRLAQLIPGARYLEIAGSQHLPNVEQPVVFNRTLLSWLDSL